MFMMKMGFELGSSLRGQRTEPAGQCRRYVNEALKNYKGVQDKVSGLMVSLSIIYRLAKAAETEKVQQGKWVTDGKLAFGLPGRHGISAKLKLMLAFFSNTE